MKTLLKGEINFVENFNNWVLEIEVKWNKKMVYITIKSKKRDLASEFISCKLSKFQLFTRLSYVTLSRSDSFSFYGNKSKYSELILENPATIQLMKTKNAIIKLEGKQLIFSGGTRKKDKSSLSNVFILNEILIKGIDRINDGNVTQQRV